MCFFLLYALALIFSIVASGWVKVENDITTYLPADTETRQGLTVMNDNFTTFGTARVMAANISDTAGRLKDRIAAVDGVYSVDFDDTDDHYKDASALYSVTFDGTSHRPGQPGRPGRHPGDPLRLHDLPTSTPRWDRTFPPTWPTRWVSFWSLQRSSSSLC